MQVKCRCPRLLQLWPTKRLFGQGAPEGYRHRTCPEVFCIWPICNQGRVHFCSFGTSGECAKHAYAPSPTAHITFFLLVRPKRRTLILFFLPGYLMMGMKNYLKRLPFFFHRILSKLPFLSAPLSVVGECDE
jgi:hypothetical protein